jgi:hypothetical protein
MSCPPSPPRYLSARYDTIIEQLPVEVALQAPRLTIDPSLYLPPPLKADGKGWHPQWGRAWQWWGAPKGGIAVF